MLFYVLFTFTTVFVIIIILILIDEKVHKYTTSNSISMRSSLLVRAKILSIQLPHVMNGWTNR